MAKKIKQSKTTEIMRSQIHLNPCNPKKHSDKMIQEQLKNLRRVGFLGGITWNETTGNLVDGHRRVMALDLHHNYDGSPDKDYSIKVESVSLTEKQEKEQLTYMALGNTKADYALIAEYYADIDPVMAGLDSFDIENIAAYLPDPMETSVEVTDFSDLLTPGEVSDNDPIHEDDRYNQSLERDGNLEDSSNAIQNSTDAKTDIKEKKQKAMERAAERYADQEAYITVSFANAEEKRMFCELAGIGEDSKFIKGSDVLEMIE